MKAPREGVKLRAVERDVPIALRSNRMLVATTGVARRVGAAALSLAGAVAFAADDNKIFFPSGPAAAPAPSTGAAGSFNTMTLILAVVLAAAGAWVLWRKRAGRSLPRESRALAIEETRSLGNRQFLVVASYEGRKFLLGVCPGKIDMLAPLDERADAGEVP
jgi:flagellar protein FliO/FliZ